MERTIVDSLQPLSTSRYKTTMHKLNTRGTNPTEARSHDTMHHLGKPPDFCAHAQSGVKSYANRLLCSRLHAAWTIQQHHSRGGLRVAEQRAQQRALHHQLRLVLLARQAP